MSENVNNKLDLSPSGRVRHEEILTHVLQTARDRQKKRRRFCAVAIVAAGLALGGISWIQFVDTERVISHVPPSPRIAVPETTPTSSDPLALLYPHLDVEIVTGNEPWDRSSNRHHAIALERINDEQLISQLSDTRLPFGLLIADGKIRLLPHAPALAVQR